MKSPSVLLKSGHRSPVVFTMGRFLKIITKKWGETLIEYCTSTIVTLLHTVFVLTLLGLELIKINTVLANFNNPRPSLTLNN